MANLPVLMCTPVLEQAYLLVLLWLPVLTLLPVLMLLHVLVLCTRKKSEKVEKAVLHARASLQVARPCLFLMPINKAPSLPFHTHLEDTIHSLTPYPLSLSLSLSLGLVVRRIIHAL
jgi:hypothetical protein